MKHRSSRAALLALGALSSSCLTGAYRIYNDTVRFPDLSPYEGYFYTNERIEPAAPAVEVTYFGTASLLIDDGRTRIMVDPFFTRPEHKLGVSALREIEPVPFRIAWVLHEAGITDLDAVLVTHAHYDHAMDAPHVAVVTGSRLYGTLSAANIARGWGMGEDEIEIVGDGSVLTFGDFTVTFIESVHGPPTCKDKDKSAVDLILEPLVPPVEPYEYEDGGTHSLHVTHPLGSMVVHPSPGVNEGDLEGFEAEVIFLGIPRLGNVRRECRDRYYAETVEQVGARHVIPVHWDYWSRSLEEPLVPLPAGAADFDGSMDLLIEKAEASGGTIQLLQAFETTVVFEGDAV
jgi:L-ascorbate metabolism protein UlaG (beta-lactamase superfamily)